jgi:hypothetical protein
MNGWLDQILGLKPIGAKIRSRQGIAAKERKEGIAANRQKKPKKATKKLWDQIQGIALISVRLALGFCPL